MSGFLTVLKKVASDNLSAGLREGASIDVARKVTVVNLFAFVGILITLILGVRALGGQEWFLALALFVCSSLFSFTHIYLRLSSSILASFISSLCLQIVLMMLCLYLVYSGGTNNTGPLWMFLVPPVVMFLSGLEKGLLNLSVFMLLYSAIVFFPDNQINAVIYSYEFKTRLLYSFATLTFLSGFYEYSRQSSYRELTKLTKEFELQATMDPLTHLLNRRGMLERIEYETARSKRDKTGMVFLIADLDHFKQINDQHGHEIGDEILSQLSELLRDAIREQDSIARWGGEEFLFLLPNTGLAQATTVAEKVRARVASEVFVINGVKLRCTLSFGVARVEDFDNIQLAINHADKRLYAAKEQGRNRVIATY